MLYIHTVNLDDTEKEKVTEIYNKYYGLMMYIAKSILSDTASAEDAVSEAFIKIIDNLDKISDVSCHKTKSFIVIIVRNTALNLYKKNVRRNEITDTHMAELPDSSLSVLDRLTNDESCAAIGDAIKALPKSLSEVLYLHISYEYDNKGIAKLLGISYDLVRKRLSRARKAVRKILSETGVKNDR